MQTALLLALLFLTLSAPFVFAQGDGYEDSSSSSSSSSGSHCQQCVSFWNELRTKVGCNANSTICKYISWVSAEECQQMIDAVCAAGCEANPASCAYVACCAVSFCKGKSCPTDY